MKKITLLTAILLSFVFILSAQIDTLYMMKNGVVINKQSVKTTDVDSILFYKPAEEIASNNYGDFGFLGVRHYAGIGTKSWDDMAFRNPSNGWIVKEWNKVLAEVLRDAPGVFCNHYPVLGARAEWSRAYIDQNLKPTHEQAQDPNWSNYIWNQREDGITNALNNPLIDNGNGIAKLYILIGITATSGQYLPPKWMRDDESLTWEGGKNTSGLVGNFHIRFDNPEAVEHVADFMTAFLKKFGDNTGVHSISLGEYYFGQEKDRPLNLNRNKYFAGARDLWERCVSAAPKDGDGNRVNILQTNPLFGGSVSVDDLEKIGIGMSESDTRLDLPVSKTPETQALKRLYDGKKVHVMIEGDSRYSRQGRKQTWDDTPNPFGHKEGYSGIATPQELYWYHGEKGPAPVYTLILNPADWAEGPQNSKNIIDAIKTFGRGGRQSEEWGPSPAALPSEKK